MKLALFNTRSLSNKGPIINEFITDNNLDILCLTETWQKHLGYYALNQTTPTGYHYLDKPRPDGRGGGIAPLHRQHIKTRLTNIDSPPSFEQLTFKLSGPKPLVIAIIYRPPKSNPAFLSDLSEFLTQLCSVSPSILLLGDFNIHIDSSDCKTATKFLDLLKCFNFTQHIDFPTHNRGHILDLVCSTEITINHLSGYDLTISDDLAIIMEIDIPIPEPKLTRTVTLRNIKFVCPSSLSACLTEKFSTLSPSLSPSPSEKCNSFLTFYKAKNRHHLQPIGHFQPRFVQPCICKSSTN
ncbi:uncharacterized protein LOC116394789 [Anarrhichthys ocellatus]|uniref:uncharacterized protein LOC116394789 n=1 Tax=Anarrhichthys ocellatus TaxID=433405 RepID=UPI0012EE84DC|nr:uncharacterized protein LOC116394789 [Anarrhichthys ocellatus]